MLKKTRKKDCDIKIKILNLTEDSDIDIFKGFYNDIYAKAFKDENERESCDNIIAQYKRIKKDKDAAFFCIIALYQNSLAGGIIADYFKETNCAIIEYIVVEERCRGKKISLELLYALVDTINNNYNDILLKYIFFETENPHMMQPENFYVCNNRLRYWHNNNALRLAINYVQPPLEKGKNSVRYLYLAVIDLLKNEPDSMCAQYVRRVLFNYFVNAFNMNHSETEKAIDEFFPAIDNIKLLPLIDEAKL